MARLDPSQPAEPGGDDDPLIGTKLGEYVIRRFLAQGGMGMVYAAEHPVLKRNSAVKVLRPELTRDKEQEERFRREAQAIGSIRHRGIIDVYNFGKLPDGRTYMQMEFLEGKTLEQLLHDEGPLPPNRALPIVDEILDALSAAHRAGVVHRDLKPSNVFMVLQSNGVSYAKLVDFGLAKQSLGGQAVKASVIAGTPEYISPEQARGGEVSAKTDLYCLGVMMFEMLSGVLPFGGSNLIEFLRAHLEQVPPRLSTYTEVPEELDDLVASLLEKKAEDRPSADQVRRSIVQILRLTRDAATQNVPRERVSKPVAPPAAVTADDLVDETHVRSSDPGMAAKVKQARERATGPKARPSVSGPRARPPAPRASRPSQPGLKRPSKGGLEPLPEIRPSTPDSQRTLIPVRPDIADAVTTAKPFGNVVADGPTPLGDTPVNPRQVPVALLVGLVLIGGSTAGVLVWRLTRPPPAPTVLPAIGPVDGIPKEDPPRKVAELAPKPPQHDPDYDAKMKAAQDAEREMSEVNRRNAFAVNARPANSPIKAGDEKVGVGDVANRGFAAELEQLKEVEANRRKQMTREELRREELRLTHQQEELKKLCPPNWKKGARADLTRRAAEKRKSLSRDPEAPGADRNLDQLKLDEKDLQLLITSAVNLEDCQRVFRMLETFAR